jgi:hypothetical protein
MNTEACLLQWADRVPPDKACGAGDEDARTRHRR